MSSAYREGGRASSFLLWNVDFELSCFLGGKPSILIRCGNCSGLSRSRFLEEKLLLGRKLLFWFDVDISGSSRSRF